MNFDEGQKLDRLERYKLSIQLRVMEALYPDDAADLAIQREIFERGYEILYDQALQSIYPDKDTLNYLDCKEVWDTMDMFDAIDRSISQLNEAEIEIGFQTKFAGYDGNNEGEFMAFAEFTVERLNRFAYVKLEKPGYFNSHSPVRPMYKRMLSEWMKVPTSLRFKMSKEQLLSVLRAGRYPENN